VVLEQFTLPTPWAFIELIFQMLYSRSNDEEEAARVIWGEYQEYHQRDLDERDPENSFIVGVIMLSLKRFSKARLALWGAVRDLNEQDRIRRLNGEFTGDTEYVKNLFKYCHYLIQAHLRPLRSAPSDAQKEINRTSLPELIGLLNQNPELSARIANVPYAIHDDICNAHEFLLAQVYEAASIRACAADEPNNETRASQVRDYRDKAKTHYQKCGGFPQEFQTWMNGLQNADDCFTV